MEFFNKAKAVRLRSHLDKYLIADDDEVTVRQSRNGGASKKARWTVELVEWNPHVIRLKSCHGKYLTAADESFLLGMTGKKVLQSVATTKKDLAVEWEPIKDGYQVKLRTKGGKFLRANGGTPPWRNSITHDVPHRTATQDWVLWEVEVVDITVFDNEYISSYASSFSSEYEYSNSNTRSQSITAGDSRENSLQATAPENRVLSNTAAQNRWPSIASDRSIHMSGRQSGMEMFNKAKAVRLQSHLGKYLVADEDEETVRQSRSGASHKARWTVEFVGGRNTVIRLKSCHGRYLTAADEPFLLGMTGKKVLQSFPAAKMDSSIEWEPVREGDYVKLMTKEGKFLRANGATPPWRNSVTHDIPHRTATQNWILWGVDVVDISVSDSDFESSFSSLSEDYVGSPVIQSRRPSNLPTKNEISGMEFFKKAKVVRLKSHFDKYLIADNDEESVIQDRAGSSENARWTVEFVEGKDNVMRLKGCQGKYLQATDEEFLLGVTGRKVIQNFPRKLDSSIEWEPIRDGMQVKLKTRYGDYLRANGGLPPWRNSITHDIPHRHHDWILWDIDVVEIVPESPPRVSQFESSDDDVISSSSFCLTSPIVPHHESRGSFGSFGDSPMKSEGRLIYYYVADDNGNVNDAIEGQSFQFKGHGLEELIEKLEEETGLENIIICSRNRVNGKLYPLRLALPPNKKTMHVVVVPSTSKVARNFMPETPPSA